MTAKSLLITGMALFVLVGCDGRSINPIVSTEKTPAAAWVWGGPPATDIGGGTTSILWIIGATPEPGGYGIYYTDYTSFPQVWTKVQGAAVAIDVSIGGQPWVCNSSKEIYMRSSNGSWTKMPGLATDVGCNGTGDVWVVGTDNQIHWWNATKKSFWRYANPWGLGAMRLDVDINGKVWVVFSNGAIATFERTAQRWLMKPGTATDIGCNGKNPGEPYIIRDGVVYSWKESSQVWEIYGSGYSGAKRVSVALFYGAIVNSAGQPEMI